MEKTVKTATLLALAGAFATVVSLGVAPKAAHAADDFEKCFGISVKGGNDCASEAGNSCAGTAKADYEGTAWKLVKTGTCTGIAVDVKSADGTVAKRKGSLTEITG
jgi:uncharacterized membrane protein